MEIYHGIDFNVARTAVLTAIELIEKISHFTSTDMKDIQYPFWLKRPQNDGLFQLSRVRAFLIIQ